MTQNTNDGLFILSHHNLVFY